MAKKLEGLMAAKGLKIALLISRFNDLISNKLREGAVDCLVRHEAAVDDITEIYVPGAFEIPMTARRLAESNRFDAVICLGAVIRGATPHFDMVAHESAKGVAQAAYDTGIPVIYGILTTDTLEQAVERAGTKSGNKGWDAAMTAIEMVNLFKQI